MDSAVRRGVLWNSDIFVGKGKVIWLHLLHILGTRSSLPLNKFNTLGSFSPTLLRYTTSSLSGPSSTLAFVTLLHVVHLP